MAPTAANRALLRLETLPGRSSDRFTFASYLIGPTPPSPKFAHRVINQTLEVISVQTRDCDVHSGGGQSTTG